MEVDACLLSWATCDVACDVVCRLGLHMDEQAVLQSMGEIQMSKPFQRRGCQIMIDCALRRRRMVRVREHSFPRFFHLFDFITIVGMMHGILKRLSTQIEQNNCIVSARQEHIIHIFKVRHPHRSSLCWDMTGLDKSLEDKVRHCLSVFKIWLLENNFNQSLEQHDMSSRPSKFDFRVSCQSELGRWRLLPFLQSWNI